MFETIGLIIATCIFAFLCFLCSCGFAVIAWLIFLGRLRPKKLILVTASIPVLTFVYIMSTAIILTIFVPNQPDEFFGDINEPLPNGYILTGLGKMSDYSTIQSASNDKYHLISVGDIERIDQEGQVMYGQINHPFGDPAGEPKPAPYFSFDTRTNQVQYFQTLAALTSFAGHPVPLIETPFFRSQEPSRKILRLAENTLFLGPPIIATMICFALLIRRRMIPTQAVL
jgi:hypothetical protein